MAGPIKGNGAVNRMSESVPILDERKDSLLMRPGFRRPNGMTLSFGFICLFSMSLLAAGAEPRQWLKVVSEGRVTLHVDPSIPLAEAKSHAMEYQRALEFLQANYPLPYPADSHRVNQYLVTKWRDFQLACVPVPGRVRMYGAAPALLVLDVYEETLTPVVSLYLVHGMTQYLYDRYRGADTHVRAAVFRAGQPSLSLGTLFRWDGMEGDPRLADFFTASFLGYLVEQYGWERTIWFAGASNLPESIGNDLETSFGVPASKIEEGWFRLLDQQRVNPPPFDTKRVFRDWDRYQEALQVVIHQRFSFDRGSLIASYTECRLLRAGVEDLPALESALDRFEWAVSRERLCRIMIFGLPLLLIVIHAVPPALRRRAAEAKVRKRRAAAGSKMR